MSSVKNKIQSPPTVPSNRTGLVDQQIYRTRRALKGVDAIAGIITLLIGVLSYLLTMAVLEHWVIPGGWNTPLRIIMFTLLILGVAWYSGRIFWRFIHQSINPAYAALAIEQSTPSLKNSLLNLLLLRGHRQQMPKQIYHAIEKQAAQKLAGVPMDSVVDRTSILRLGYVLVALVAIGTIYRIASPKDPLDSAARILLPWAEIAVPSRVQIVNVSPGTTSIARGEPLKISAELFGLENDEPAHLVYSTVDEQKINQRVKLSAARETNLFQCVIPHRIAAHEVGGVQQDLTYWIEAGDAKSPRFRVSVFSQPTLVVSTLRYEYPSYTGYPSLEVEHTGDIRALEGTRVTLMAQANKPIYQAHIDFEADGKHDLLMNSSNQRATVTFLLELEDDRRTPRYESYVLRYKTDEGRKNQLPPKYQIDIIPDYAPEIQLLIPEEAILDVTLNQEVNFEIEARDPDFALSHVTLYGAVDGEPVVEETLLNENHQGLFVGKLRKTAAELGLHIGDVMEYWVVAADNRRPQANRASTVRRKLRVVDAQQRNEGKNSDDQQQDDSGSSQSPQGTPPTGDNQNKEPGQEPNAESQESDSGESDGQGEGGLGQKGDAQQDAEPNEQGGAGANGQSGQEENPSPKAPSGKGGNQQEKGQPSSEPTESNPNDGQSGENQGEQEKVSSQGDDDGTAFERMVKHFNEQNTEPAEVAEENEADDANPAAEGANDNPHGENGGDQTTDPDNSSNSGDPQDPHNEGPGAENPPPEQQPQEAGEQPGEPQEDPAAGGQMSPEQGNAGAGENPGEEQGVPDSQGAKKPHDKNDSPAGGEEKLNDQEAPAQTEGQTESDSEGSQGGDKAGGGEEGAGQQADAEGTGGAGENTSAEAGGGQATEPGTGEPGARPGDQQPAANQTGESSKDQPGPGSESDDRSDQPVGEQPEGEQGGAPGASQNMDDPQDGLPPDQAAGQSTEDPPSTGTEKQSQGKPGESPSPPLGGGEGGDTVPPPEGELSPADQANLDYARKQTDLVLEKLEDQLKNKQVDEKLLEKLGWNQDELRRFVNRWKNLKAQAQADKGSKEAQAQLDNSLRNLGLLPKQRFGYRSQTAKDHLRDLQEAYRGRTPLEYQEQVRAYIKGTATSNGNNE